MTDDATSRALERWRPGLRDVLLAAGIGAGLGVVLWTGSSDEPPVPFVLAAMWIGLCIYGVSTAVMGVACRWVDRLRGPALWAAIGMLFFFGGAGGFALAKVTLELAAPVIGSWVGYEGSITLGSGWGSLLFAGGIGLVLGIVFFRYELLQGRLEASQERLRTSELAARELETARDIQERILPPPLVEGEGFRVVSRNRAARVVAGDFYEVFRFGDGALGVAVADVSGKGIGASLVMASVKARLPLLAAERSVAETLVALNEALRRELGQRQFVALSCVRFQPWDGSYEIGNAGLPDPYLWTETAVEPLAVPGPRLPLGLKDDLDYRTIVGDLAPGGRILFITDGLPEASTSNGEPLGYARLEELLLAPDGDAGDRLDAVLARLGEETTALLEDDWTAVVLERPAAG